MRADFGRALQRAPVIVMATEGAVRHLRVDQVIAMATVARRQARVPVLFHFDHGQSLKPYQ